ncbi:MAG: ATP-binding protein [Polyangiaceae bacterium]
MLDDAVAVASCPTGRGLGVLNVKKVVETVHGGRVGVESAPGEGTTVSILLSRKQPIGEVTRPKRK